MPVEDIRLLPWVLFTIGCLAGLLLAEYRQARRLPWMLKLLASSGFVGAALAAGALHSPYGQVLLAAFVLSWLGDAFLLFRCSAMFLCGLASFLLAHVAFSLAFILHGQTWIVAGVALGVLVLPAFLVAGWLRPRVAEHMRKPVWSYIAAITLMLSLAAGAVGSGASRFIFSGALAFYLSDISVARDRFVKRSFLNRLWGLPLYYVGQLLLALSIGFFGKSI